MAPLATGYETKPAAQDRIDAAARAAGRDPAGIRRAIQLAGTITDVPCTAFPVAARGSGLALTARPADRP